DARPVAAGIAYSAGSIPHFGLARYNVDGSLDSTFGTGGKVMTDFAGTHSAAFALALQPDGKVVAAGRAGYGDAANFTLVRYKVDGSLDATFGVGGRVTTDLGGADSAAALVL